MVAKVDLELQKLEEQKRKLQVKERLLKEKEKQKRVRRFSSIGKLAHKAGIDHLDEDILFGAFIEISSSLSSKEKQEDWKTKALSYNPGQKKQQGDPLSISFDSEPGPEIKKKMKKLGFRWNSFRNEFYGYGKKDEIQDHLKDVNYSIEVLD